MHGRLRSTGACLLLSFANEASGQNTIDRGSELWREHEGRPFVDLAAPCLTPGSLTDQLRRLASAHPGLVLVEPVGVSFQGRPISMVSLGRGPRSILLWSQMHGNEPSATPALLDLADFLARHQARPDIARILEAFTLRMIPMLNPDGAVRYERRNAQGIDINRDALMLATAEGRLLKSIRDRYSPFLGFNLHDLGRRVSVGDTGVLSSISLLAVAGDAAGTLTPERLRARRVASRIVAALSPFIPGGIARYDEDWNPRAFGDNITAWGTPVVLIESGAFPPGGGFTELTRLNFVALVSVLEGLARDDLAEVSPEVYDSLLRNRADVFADVAIIGASILEPGSGKWFKADVAFDVLASDRALAGCAEPDRIRSRMVEVGDSSLLTSGQRIDGRGLLLAALAEDSGAKPGEITREALLALRPDATITSEDPREVLSALRLSDQGRSRNDRAFFVVFVPDRARGGTMGRYVVVTDGIGLDSLLK